jgi:molecular chaperone GrpE
MGEMERKEQEANQATEEKIETNEKADKSATSDVPGDGNRSRRKKLRREEDREVEKLRTELQQKDEENDRLKEEIANLKEAVLRRQADFENYKKRNLKQQEEFRKFAIKDLALDIININDDLLRAIDAASAGSQEEIPESTRSFIEGVEMISRRIEETLAGYGVTEIEAEGCEFDPNVHEAFEIEMSPDVDRETVTLVHQKGFSLHGLVLRSAKVRVTKPQPAGEAGQKNAAEETGK